MTTNTRVRQNRGTQSRRNRCTWKIQKRIGATRTKRHQRTRKIQRGGGRLPLNTIRAMQAQARLIQKATLEHPLGYGSGVTFQFMTLPEDEGSIFVKMTVDPGLDDVPAAGGEFIFLLEMPENFPKNPPNWFMFTEVARCERGTRLCLNPTSGWHIYEWQELAIKPAIPDMLVGFASHFLRYGGEGSQGVGWKSVGIDTSSSETVERTKAVLYPLIQEHAIASRAYNITHFNRHEVYMFLANHLITTTGELDATMIAFRNQLIEQSKIRPDESLMYRFCDVLIFGDQECPTAATATTTTTATTATTAAEGPVLQVVRGAAVGAEMIVFTVPEHEWSHLVVEAGKIRIPDDYTLDDITALEYIMKHRFIGINLGHGIVNFISEIKPHSVDKVKTFLYGTPVGGLSQLNLKDKFDKVILKFTTIDENIITISVESPATIAHIKPDLPSTIEFDSEIVIKHINYPTLIQPSSLDGIQIVLREEPIYYKLGQNLIPRIRIVSPTEFDTILRDIFLPNTAKSIEYPSMYSIQRGDGIIVELGPKATEYLQIARYNTEALSHNISINVINGRTTFKFLPEYITADEFSLLEKILNATEYVGFYKGTLLYVVDGLIASNVSQTIYKLIDESDAHNIPGLNRRPKLFGFKNEIDDTYCEVEHLIHIPNLKMRSFTQDKVIWEYNHPDRINVCDFILGKPGILKFKDVNYIPKEISTIIRWGIPVRTISIPAVDEFIVRFIKNDELVREIVVSKERLNSLDGLIYGKYASIVANILLGIKEGPLIIRLDNDISEEEQKSIIYYIEGVFKIIRIVDGHKRIVIYKPPTNYLIAFFEYPQLEIKQIHDLSGNKFAISIYINEALFTTGLLGIQNVITLMPYIGREFLTIISNSIFAILSELTEASDIPVTILTDNDNIARGVADTLSTNPIAFKYRGGVFACKEYDADAILGVKNILGGYIEQPVEFLHIHVNEKLYIMSVEDCLFEFTNLNDRIINSINATSITTSNVHVDFTGPTLEINQSLIAFFGNHNNVDYLIDDAIEFLFYDYETYREYKQCVEHNENDYY